MSDNNPSQQEPTTTVFDDPLHLALLDYLFSYFEERWIAIGSTVNQKLLQPTKPPISVSVQSLAI